jgi:preprotein translocase subunit YajC
VPSFLIVFVLMLVVMYVLMIRPQRRRQQEQRSRITSAGVGDDILTNGGIYGTIVQVDGDDVVVEIADGVTVHMTRQGITAILPPEEEEVDEDEVDEDEADEDAVAEAAGHGDLDEAPVMPQEEAVTVDADSDAAGADRR